MRFVAASVDSFNRFGTLRKRETVFGLQEFGADQLQRRMIVPSISYPHFTRSERDSSQPLARLAGWRGGKTPFEAQECTVIDRAGFVVIGALN